MKTQTDLKVEYTDVVRALDVENEEERSVQAKYQEQARKLQEQDRSAQSEASALLAQIAKRKADLTRRKMEIEGVLKWFEQAEKEKEETKAILEAAKPTEEQKP